MLIKKILIVIIIINGFNNGFAGKKIIILNIRANEIDMNIYHLKNILM